MISKLKGGIQIDDIVFRCSNEKFMELTQYAQRRPWVRRVEGGYIDRRTDEFIADEDYFYHVYANEELMFNGMISSKERQTVQKLKAKFNQIKEWCGEVQFISDQRLIRADRRRSEGSEVIDVIRELPRKLKAQITTVSEEYSRVANALDSTYPKRLFAAKEGIKNQREYQEKLEEANTKFKKLNMYNLVDMSIIDEKKYNEIYSTALKIYFDDFAEKYKVFQNLISKLDLFTEIINSRLTFKHIRIGQENGFEIVDNDNEQKIMQLSELSSGEKQEIVLFYKLIFDTKNSLLLLIDEPEISLHITWQKKFLDDLLKVSNQIGLQVVVATHSPQIVSNHMNIQIDLGELYGDELNKGKSK